MSSGKDLLNEKTIHWDDSVFSVGIAKMDDEHKQLVGLINALGAQIGKADTQFLEKIINTLVLYTKVHFSHEEKILAKMHYQKLLAHKQQHSNFIKIVDQFYADFRKTPDSKALAEKIHHFLKEWLLRHILVEDKEYGQFLVE